MFRRKSIAIAISALLGLSIFASAALACSTIAITPGASTTGSASVTQTVDAGGAAYEVYKYPAQTWPDGAMVEVLATPQVTTGLKLYEMDMIPTGWFIPQVKETYGYIGWLFGLINEKQVGFGETSISGRSQSRNRNGYFEIGGLSHFALQRAATAREAIQVMGDLAVKYGFIESGECLQVADANEVWTFEIVGPGALWEVGDSEPGAYWVAQRVPDGHISSNCNNAVISTINWNDKNNFMYGPGILEYATNAGWYNPASGEEFSWRKHFCNATSYATCARRVWRIFCLAAPSLASTLNEMNLPFSVPVDKKLSIADILDIQADHYEGTQYDMTGTLTAGPWNSPRRRGSLRFGDMTYSWQRGISQTQTEFSITTQSRSYLPDAIGGLVWYAPVNTDATCAVPLYASVKELSPALNVDAGSHMVFSKKSLWWSISTVSTYIDIKYDVMIKEVKAYREIYERSLIKDQQAFESAVLAVYNQSPAQAISLLTDFCKANVEKVRDAWWELLDFLMWKYNAGFVIENGRVNTVSYPESWLRLVVQYESDTDHYKS